MSEDGRIALGGIIECKARWGLTWRGWALVVALVPVIGVCFVLTVYPFLAPTERVPASLLVVEGWMPPSMMKEVAAEFKSANYERAVVVRSVLATGDKYESGRYMADWLARILVEDGVPESKLTTLVPIVVHKDRTYHSALAVKEWISAQHLSLSALDIATDGPHARRSRFLYQKAFGDSVKVGVISFSGHEYDSHHWWRTSAGVRDVIGESIAYLYARLIFSPPNPAKVGQ
jgi:hypothetical protein